MKKLISIDHLEIGMFLEAEVATKVENGAERSFLQVCNALPSLFTTRKARLTGRMDALIAQQGGLLIKTQKHIHSLRATGVKMVSIDTDKGRDLPDHVQPITDPKRTPPPEGRLVHFNEEIKRAKQARAQSIATIRETLTDIASGKGVDMVKVQSASEIITESILRNMDAMVSLTRIKQHDPYTAVHCINVCTLVVAMAQAGRVEQEKLPMIVAATMLHDIGKTMVPLKILNKPGPFESNELEEMRRHALYSSEILREAGGFSEEAIAIASQHHELLDGSGYPLGLKGDEIHPFARMTAVADVYDALTSRRVYKPSMPMYQALLQIHKKKGIEFDESAVNLIVKALGIFPVGSLVALNTGERGMVFEPNPMDSRKPTVGVLTMPNQKLRGAPLIMNLARRSEAGGREITKALAPVKLDVDVEATIDAIAKRGERTERRMR